MSARVTWLGSYSTWAVSVPKFTPAWLTPGTLFCRVRSTAAAQRAQDMPTTGRSTLRLSSGTMSS